MLLYLVEFKIVMIPILQKRQWTAGYYKQGIIIGKENQEDVKHGRFKGN